MEGLGLGRAGSDGVTHTLTKHTHTTHTHSLTHTPADYKSRGGQLPVRWTAIEALEDRKFSDMTDVWSCGVLLYEIWTRADTPYKEWSNQKVWVEVAAGYRLPRPDGCPADIYDRMRACWREAQPERPTAGALAAFFRAYAGRDTGDGDDGDEAGTAAKEYLVVSERACVFVKGRVWE